MIWRIVLPTTSDPGLTTASTTCSSRSVVAVRASSSITVAQLDGLRLLKEVDILGCAGHEQDVAWRQAQIVQRLGLIAMSAGAQHFEQGDRGGAMLRLCFVRGWLRRR